MHGYDGVNVANAKASLNYTVYGVLYNWPAAMNETESSDVNPSGMQGVCPDGWHLPSHAEWTELENYLADNGYNYDGTIGGDVDKIAKSLTDASGWKHSPYTGVVGNTDFPASINKSGFSALPGGYRNFSGTFSFTGYTGCWWSSTDWTSGSARRREITFNDSSVISGSDFNKFGFSVRCVKD